MSLRSQLVLPFIRVSAGQLAPGSNIVGMLRFCCSTIGL